MPLSLPASASPSSSTCSAACAPSTSSMCMTGGGPVRSTETIGYFMYRESMTQFKLGYGAAATVILLLVAVFVISVPAIIQRTAGAR